MTKKLLLLIVFLIIFFLAGAYYWLYYLGNPVPFTETEENPRGFNPFNRTTVTPPVETPPEIETPKETTPPPIVEEKIPILRKLSTTPIGGMSASTTANTSVLRFVDRGTGHINEVLADSKDIVKISNTTLPRIYESYWNKDLNAVILRYIKEDSDVIVNFYGEIRKTNSTGQGTSTDKTPYEIRGKFLSSEIKDISVSPKKDRIFTLNIENNRGVGYISQFDEMKKTRIFDTPLVQINTFWPEENTLFISTKGSGSSLGYAYSVNTKTSSLKKILGEVPGLTVLPSTDAKQILFSSSPTRSISTSLYNIQKGSATPVIFKTLPEKCVWSTLHQNELYCAVPTEIPGGLYPDDWYKGTVSFVDQIWHLDTTTGEVRLIANLLRLSDSLIDVMNLVLDPKENFLYFINKNDLSLWSLDLNQ